jgi:hypothetical protein
LDASEKNGEAVGLGDDRSDTQGGRERFAEHVAEHRVHDDGNERQPGAKQGGSFDTVHVGHGEIEDYEVGLKSESFINGFDTIGSFAANFKRGMVLEENAHRAADGNFVFDDENALGHRREKHSTGITEGE